MDFDGPLLNGRYRLGPRLGRGAQAVTSLARDEEQGRVVVVKQLRLGDASEWKRFDLFEREIKTLRALDHPGVPRYIDAFESEPGTFNLVMERAPGATLWAYNKKRRFTDGDLLEILVKTLEILRYLHGLRPPVIHRDIKPANLVRAADGTLALVDFGGVRDVTRPEGGSTVIGTFGYMAPEQLHGEATPATDLYALGATIVSLAGGIEPEHVPRKGLRMDLERHLPGMDAGLREVLRAMVEPDPGGRLQSAEDALARLAKASLHRGSPVVPTRREASQSLARVERAAASRGGEAIQTVVDEVAEFTADLPGPLRLAFRLMLFLIAMGGYLGLTLARVALVPITYAIATTLISDRNRPRALEVRSALETGLDQARGGLRALARGRRRPALPAPR